MASVRKIKGGSEKKLSLKPGIHLYIADYRDRYGFRHQERRYLTNTEAQVLQAELTLKEEAYKDGTGLAQEELKDMLRTNLALLTKLLECLEQRPESRQIRPD